MADDKEVDNLKQVEKSTTAIKNDNREINEILNAQGKNYAESIDKMASLISLTRSLGQEIDDHLKITRNRTREEKTLLSIASTLGSIASQNLELSRKDNTLAKSRANLAKTQASIDADLRLARTEISKQDEIVFQKIAEEQSIIKVFGEELIADKLRISQLSEQAQMQALQTLKINEQSLEDVKEQTRSLENLLSEEGKRVIKLEQAEAVAGRIGEELQKTEKRQADINKTTGIAGEILEGVNRIGLRVFGGLGINLGVISGAFEDAKQAMEDFGAEVERSGEGVGSLVSRTIALGKGISAFAKNLPNLLTDPLVLAGVLLSNFGDLNKEAVKFQRLTGQTAPLLDTLNMKLVSSVQYLEVASSLSERLGMNVTGAFSSQNLASAAELMNTMGMTAEAAGQLALISETNRTSVDGTLDDVVGQVNAYNRTNRTALNHGQIVNDIAKASEETLASFAGQSGELGKAAAVARRLGMELSKLESIADNLLNFESSIENELQAQLLTGMDINLNKARELALTNQIGKMGEEIFANTVDLEKFSNMNRIAQQGLAEALGMSRQELAKIALQRAVILGLTNEALENAAGMTAEDLKRTEAMQQLTISIQKIGQALAIPVEKLATFLSNTFVLKSVLGGIALLYGVKMYQSLVALVTQTSVKAKAEKTMLGITTQVTTQMQQQVALTGQIANNIARAAVSSKGITPAFPGATVGRGAGGKFTSMGAGAAGAAGAAGSVGAGAAMAGGKLAAKGFLRFIPYVGWALLAFDVLKRLSSSKPKEIQDGMINPDGGLMVSGPKGSIQLDPRDSIVAGTNLTGGASGQSNRELINKIEELISAVKQSGDVFLDGDKVGTALTMGSYRNS